MAGGEFLSFNNSIFLSERETADRNYALAYYMKENKCFPKGTNIKSCLEFWYQVRNELPKAILTCLSLNPWKILHQLILFKLGCIFHSEFSPRFARDCG